MDKKEPRIKFPFSNQTIFAMVMNDEGRCKAFLERIFPGQESQRNQTVSKQFRRRREQRQSRSRKDDSEHALS